MFQWSLYKCALWMWVQTLKAKEMFWLFIEFPMSLFDWCGSSMGRQKYKLTLPDGHHQQHGLLRLPNIWLHLDNMKITLQWLEHQLPGDPASLQLENFISKRDRDFVLDRFVKLCCFIAVNFCTYKMKYIIFSSSESLLVFPYNF